MDIKFRNITISGSIGSGTTTLGKRLAKELGWQFVEGGEVFRQTHEDLNISEEEVSKRLDEFDREFDKAMKAMLLEKEHQVVESHLAGLNAKGIAGVFTIRLVCEEEGIDREDVRIARVARRDGLAAKLARQQVVERGRGNVEKYQRLYGINPYTDESLYNVTINTLANNEEEVLAIALERLVVRD